MSKDIPRKRLLSHPNFRSMVEFNHNDELHLTGEFEPAIAAANEILAEVERSIR